VRPGVLDTGWQRDRSLLGERGAIAVNRVMSQPFSNAAVERVMACSESAYWFDSARPPLLSENFRAHSVTSTPEKSGMLHGQ
jgi:hypothetical protein